MKKYILSGRIRHRQISRWPANRSVSYLKHLIQMSTGIKYIFSFLSYCIFILIGSSYSRSVRYILFLIRQPLCDQSDQVEVRDQTAALGDHDRTAYIFVHLQPPLFIISKVDVFL